MCNDARNEGKGSKEERNKSLEAGKAGKIHQPTFGGQSSISSRRYEGMRNKMRRGTQMSVEVLTSEE